MSDTSPARTPVSRCTWKSCCGALARTGAVRLTALSWSPLGLGLPGVREVVPVQRPDMPAGSLKATLWKLWFDQWACLFARLKGRDSILFHGLDGFLPVGPALARPERRHRARPGVAGSPRALRATPPADVPRPVSHGRASRRPIHRGVALHGRRPDASGRRRRLQDRRRVPRARPDLHGVDTRSRATDAAPVRAGGGRCLAAQEHAPADRGFRPLASAGRTPGVVPTAITGTSLDPDFGRRRAARRASPCSATSTRPSCLDSTRGRPRSSIRGSTRDSDSPSSRPWPVGRRSSPPTPARRRKWRARRR